MLVKRMGEFAEVTRVMAAAMTRDAQFDNMSEGPSSTISW